MDKIYQRELDEVIKEFDTSIEDGLSKKQVEDIRSETGENKLEESEEASIWEILLDNLNNIIVYLLGFAAIVSVFMGDWIEAIAILIAVLISVLTGVLAEWNAQRSVDALQDMVTTHINVLRDGDEIEVESVELVPGDIMMLEEGDAIPADGRLIEVNNFAVMESALTGESEAVDKDADSDLNDGDKNEDGDVPLGDRLNMVFSGTAVTRGKAKAVVTAIAMDTEVGKISEMLDEDNERQSPLDREIDQLGKALIIVAFIAAALVVVIGLITGYEVGEILQVAIILAVAAIPEALPAVQTITLANGMETMADHQALVKSLSAVETLGSTSIIASDKTGTLTENQMMVERLIVKDDNEYQVTGNGYEPQGELQTTDEDAIELNFDQSEDSDYQALSDLIIAGFLSSEATLVLEENSDEDNEENNSAQEVEDLENIDDSDKEFSINGDPTDGALTVLGYKIGLTPKYIEENNYGIVGEIPFDSDKKYMAAHYRYPDETQYIIVKGAPDVMSELTELNDNDANYWDEKNEMLADEGMRVIALAKYKLEDNEIEAAEDDLEAFLDQEKGNFDILGLFGIMDPPRSDVAESVELTQNASIQLKMITGDHPKTASIIAKEIGINHWENTMTGQEIDEIHESDTFIDKIHDTAVFARVSPENKQQIIKSLQDDQQVVAMTGDGVNDAPALNAADIGVAMGIRGTEVAKEASDMILTDDRYSTIVDAVREGRIIFENIKKYVSFLFSCNMVEIVSILLTIVFLFPMPLTPLMILYLNLVVDVGPAIGLAFEPAEEDVMEHKPRDKESGLVSKGFLSRIIMAGIIIGLGAFAVFYITYDILGNPVELAQTMTFAYMAVAQVLHIFNVRKSDSFGLDKSLLQNKPLMFTMVLSIGLLMLAIYVPFLNNIIGTEPLSLIAWAIVVLTAVVITLVVHLFKKAFGLK
ncbi:HAD-IC family P-type ATPase [Aerococcaceae bacterium DSM 111022]|nr:HAD-IC family P-type ATPase [Aerococcaceae bacterium DSM 111022]